RRHLPSFPTRRSSDLQDFPAHQLGLPGMISDCLPDGWGLLLMDRLFRSRGLPPPTPLERLSFLGDRAMGALTFSPSSPVDEVPEDRKSTRLNSSHVKI